MKLSGRRQRQTEFSNKRLLRGSPVKTNTLRAEASLNWEHNCLLADVTAKTNTSNTNDVIFGQMDYSQTHPMRYQLNARNNRARTLSSFLCQSIFSFKSWSHHRSQDRGPLPWKGPSLSQPGQLHLSHGFLGKSRRAACKGGLLLKGARSNPTSHE